MNETEIETKMELWMQCVRTLESRVLTLERRVADLEWDTVSQRLKEPISVL